MVENKGVFIPQTYISKVNHKEFDISAKKKVYSRPAPLDFDIEDEEQRKRMRVSRFRHQDAPEWMREQMLSSFLHKKEERVDFTLKEKLMKDISMEGRVDVRQGEPSYVQVPIKNPFKNTELFRVEIEDEEQREGKQEVFFVGNLEELEYLHSKGYYA